MDLVVKKEISPETLVVGIDYDGTADSRRSQLSVIHQLDEIITDNPHYKHLMVYIASARKSVWLDASNAMLPDRPERYTSCAVLGTTFLDDLRKHFGARISISFESLLMHDVEYNLPRGRTFLAMEQMSPYYEAYATQKKKNGFWVNDMNQNRVDMFGWNGKKLCDRYWKTLSKEKLRELSQGDVLKRDLTYLHMQDAAQIIQKKHEAGELNNAEFTYVLMDDRADIVSELGRFYKQNPGLVPHTGAFRAIHQQPLFFADCSTTLMRGLGPINHDIESMLRSIRQEALQAKNYQTTYAGLLEASRYNRVVAKREAPAFDLTSFVADTIVHYAGTSIGLIICASVYALGGAKQQRLASQVGFALLTSTWFSTRRALEDDDTPPAYRAEI